MSAGPVAAAVLVAFALTSCLDDSTDEAYQRGYNDGLHDGWAETCNDIRSFSATIEQTLKAERIC